MKRRIGSKVKIKSIEWYNKNKWPDGFVRGEAVGFNEFMSIHCGAEAIIVDAYLSFGSQCYSLNIDDGSWTWVEYMFDKDETMTLSKRKIGDLVRIKSHEWADNLTWDDRANIPFGFNGEMEEYCGQLARITSLWKTDDNITGYSIDIDGNFWSWNEYMFEQESCVYDIE